MSIVRKSLTTGLAFILIGLTSVSGQSLCDGLELTSVHVNPLAPDYIGIHVTNNSSELFGYPGFRIYLNDELVGEENVDFFGIGNESAHGVMHSIEDIVPGQTYNLVLELWTGFYDQLACSFEESVVLVPTDVCHPISFWAYQDTDKSITDPILMEITDGDGNIVYSAAHQFSPDTPYYNDELCLYPGCYTGTFTTSDAVISADINFSFQTAETGGLVQVLATAGDAFVTLPIDVWSSCGPTAIDQHTSEADDWNVYPNPSSTRVNFSQAVSGSVLDVCGNVIGKLQNSTFFDLNLIAPGVYFIQTAYGVKRFMVE